MRTGGGVTSVRTFAYNIFLLSTQFISNYNSYQIFCQFHQNTCLAQNICYKKNISFSCLRLQINYNKFRVSQSTYSSQQLLPNTGYPLMIKTRDLFRTQTTFTTCLRYPVNYFLKTVSSYMFECVLNTPLKTFLLPFHYSFLIETFLVEDTFVFRAVCLQLLCLLPRKTFTWHAI